MGGRACCRGHDTCPKTGMKLRKSTLEPDAALKAEVNRWLKEQTAVARAGRASSGVVPKQTSQVPARVDPVAEGAASVVIGGISLQDSSPMPDLEPTAAASWAQQPAQGPVRSIFADQWAAEPDTGTPKTPDAAPDYPATERNRPPPLAATGWADIMERRASPAAASAVRSDAALASGYGEEHPH